MSKLRVILLGALVLLPAVAQAGDRWFHLRVESRDSGGEEVNLNLPLSVVEAMLPSLEVDELRHGRIRIDGWDGWERDGMDLRAFVDSIGDLPDAEFLTVRSDDENIRIAKENGLLLIDVDGDGRRDERVRIRVPIEVFEAMVGGHGELDLIAGLDALGRGGGTDLVHVESDDETVRIWIDGRRDGR